MDGANKLEKAVLSMLLAGDDESLVVLRAQAARGRVTTRERSGVGFFCTFEIPPDAPRLRRGDPARLGDVKGSLRGLEHGAGFVLFVRDGHMHMLEAYSYDEPWPPESEEFSLEYIREPRTIELPRPE